VVIEFSRRHFGYTVCVSHGVRYGLISLLTLYNGTSDFCCLCCIVNQVREIYFTPTEIPPTNFVVKCSVNYIYTEV
jgi:hypothetical protein